MQRIKFSPHGDFRNTLNARVDEYFETTGLNRRGHGAMYLKTTIIFLWFFLSYVVLVFAPVPFWVRILATISLGLAGAGIGTAVMHDAGHGSYSKYPRLNRLIFFSLDFLGGSSYVWRYKHNVLHHTYTNIEGHDDDLDMGFLGRLAPEQRRLPFHALQHLYIWFLYGLIGVKWFFFDDFICWVKGKVGGQNMPRPKGVEAIALVVGKISFFFLAFVIPALVHSISWVIVFYLLTSFVLGLTLAVTFQLAHCVEEASFPSIAEHHRIEEDWMTHQVLTTVDFAPTNKLLSWYVGGLNFQVEHHLFPRISHIHYPQMSKIVAATCEEFGIPYSVQPTLWGGIRSHYRYLRRMGQPTPSLQGA